MEPSENVLTKLTFIRFFIFSTGVGGAVSFEVSISASLLVVVASFEDSGVRLISLFVLENDTFMLRFFSFLHGRFKST